ncbi:MAG: dockerin type I domain-containing protein [Planctomycetota bacterium]|nr:dockerin type I domain-containing protein [Planctomycetota bacterium]
MITTTHVAATSFNILGGLSAGDNGITADDIEQVLVEAGDGGDTITLNMATGLDYTVLGGNPIGLVGDTLVLVPTAAPVFTPGPENDAGGFAVGGDHVSFDEIEAVTVDLSNAGGAATIMGTGDDDHITATGTDTGEVEVQVNDGPVVTYTSATSLTIQGKNGDDDIVIDAASAGIGVAFTVEAGSSTNGSDTLTVLSIAGAVDVLTVSPTSQGAGTVSHSGAAGDVGYTGIENLELVGQLADLETFAVTGTAGEDLFEYFSALTPDEGEVQGTMDIGGAGAGPYTLPTITFSGMHPFAARTFGSATADEGDNFLFFGTSLDDEIAYDGAGGLTNRIDGNLINTIALLASLGDLLLAGLDGSDTFDITPDADVVIVVQGSNPGAGSDTLNFNGTGGVVTLDLTTSTITEAGLEPVSYSGIESVNLDTDDGALTVVGTVDNDLFTVTPLGAGMNGRFTHNLSSGVSFSYDNAASITFEDIAGGGGDDVVEILGDEAIDLVTAPTASSISVDGSTVTIGSSIEELDVQGLGGNDDINLTGFTGTTRVEIYGGDGNDTIRGSDLADIIYGGAGNDILMGGLGNDFLYGEEGNDIFGNPTLSADGVADDPGADQNFGGAGFDNFVWEAGDGPDVNNGGDDGADIFRFFGNLNGGVPLDETFELRAGGTPTHLNAVFNGVVTVDNHGIEDVIVDGLGGADSFIVNDLFTTEVVSVNLVLGAADLAVDDVTVNGRNVADNLNLTTGGAGLISIQGLRYNVNLTAAEIGDLLTVNGNDGNDVISVGAGVEGVTRLTLNGNAGNDTLDVHYTVFNAAAVVALDGGADNDTLIGGLGNESMDGGGGDDTFTGNGGTDAVGGGIGGLIGDTILVPGTPGDDLITTALNASGHLLVTINGVTTTYTNFTAGPIASAGVDKILVQGGLGFDRLTVDSTNGAIPIPITYDGGQDYDSLTLTGGTATSDIYSPGPNPGQGLSTIVIGGVTQTVSFTGLEPVIDLVAGPLVVNANNSDNAINYDQSLNNAAWGRVSIDSLETIEFSNKTTLTINALAGSDTINLNNPVAPTGLTGITVNGGDPTASDTVIVNGSTSSDTIVVSQFTTDGALITGAQPVPVTVSTIEHLTINGQGGDDSLTIETPVGEQLIFLEDDGDLVDTGSIRMRNILADGAALLPLNFLGLGGGGDLNFTDISGNRVDELSVTARVNGNASNNFSVDSVDIGLRDPSVGNPNRQMVAIIADGVLDLNLIGLDGDDTFNIFGDHPFNQIFVDGGSPGASDVLNFFGTNTGNVTLNLEATTITETGFGSVAYSGMETINLNAGALSPTIVATNADDDITVTVYDANSGKVERGMAVQQNGQVAQNVVAPLVNYSNTDGTAVNIDLRAGEDTLVVIGNADAQTFDIDVSTSGVAIDDAANGVGNDGGVTYTGAESLSVFGLEGDDTFNVTPGAIPIFIDGGDPISTVGDTLSLIPAGVPTFTPGPEGDEGGFDIVGAQPVSFNHIEAANVNLAGVTGQAAIIMGTGDDDQITAVGIVGATTGPNQVDVQVNDGPIVSYTSALDLTLQGKNGDDDIDVGVNVTGLGVVFNVDGGLPTAGSDQLRVTGVDGDTADIVNWTPSTGVLTVLGGAINVTAVETLVYDGQSDGDLLTVTGTTDAESFEHQPGTAVDSGFVGIRSGGGAQLGINYENMGDASTVTVAGSGGGDSLTALGTGDSDSVNIIFTLLDAIDIDLTSAYGTHIDLLTTGVASYDVDTLEGDDDVTLTATVNASGTFELHGGGPGIGSDTLRVNATPSGGPQMIAILPDTANPDDQDITGLGAIINSTGFELVRFVGDGGDDTLTVNPGDGDNDLLVEADHPNAWDTVTSDSLPKVDFIGMATFIADTASDQGSDTVTFKTWFLQGAAPANYQMMGNATDTLVIEGSDGAGDSFTLTNPTVGDVAVTDNNSFATPDVVVTGTGVGRIQVNTLGGDDTVTVDESGGLITPLIGYDGDTGSDVLNVTGTTAAGNVTYSPGPAVTEGRLTYDATMTIDFVNLEPINDNVPAATLTVNGTNADNAINYTAGAGGGIFTGNTGLVSVDGFETIEFNNKDNLVINSGAGDDVVNLNNPTGFTSNGGTQSITVNGDDPTASDTVIINGSTAADAINVSPLTTDSTTVTGVQAVAIVSVNSSERLVINGHGGDDALTYTSPSGGAEITFNPGANVDSGTITADGFAAGEALVPLAFEDLGAGGSLTFANFAGTRSDGLDVIGTDNDDQFDLAADGTVQIVKPAFNVPVTLPISTPGVTFLRMIGRDGDDTFNVPGDHPFDAGMEVQGGNPSSGSDVLNFTGSGANPVTVDLGLQRITETSFGSVNYTGIETANVDAATADLTVNTGTGDDHTVVTPTGANAGTLVNNNAAPTVNFTNSGMFTVDQQGGDDVLQVRYTTNADAITVNVPAGVISDGVLETVNFINAETETLEVFGEQGDDAFTVTSDPNIPVFIDGGNPIGVTGDRLNLIADTTSMFSPGPEGDEGGFVLDGNAPVSFDHIEAATVTDPTGNDLVATVMGTQDDDDITAQGVAANEVNVAVNEGPVVRYIGVASLNLLGKWGDDDFTIDVNVDALGVTFTVDGSLPTAGSDELRVTGVDGIDDMPTWTPNAADGGTLQLLGQAPINVIGVESLIYDGESDDETLTVSGAGRFVHTPGTVADAGRIDLQTLATTRLRINYENLGADGTAVLNGTGANDTAVVHGTRESDTLQLSFTASNDIVVDLSNGFGPHVTVTTNDVENYEIRAGEGDDNINLASQVLATGTFGIYGDGNGDGSDSLNITGDSGLTEALTIRPDATESDDQDIVGLKPNAADAIDVTGIELITFNGGNDADTLIVELGSGDNTARVERGNNADLVTSDSLPNIEFESVNTFTIVGQAGADVVTFATWFLSGAIEANYTADLGGTDTLVIEGVDGAGSTGNANDRFVVTRPTGAAVRVADNKGIQGGTPVVVTATNALTGRLQVNSLGGDDWLTVDVGAADLIGVPITFDGGLGNDLLIARGTPATPVVTTTYTPGAAVTEGRLTYDSSMTIDFLNLEPVVDLIPAANLVVNGTNADNAINYTAGPNSGIANAINPAGVNTGLVSVDGFETIEFGNKVILTLNGRAGDDVISLNNDTTPALLAGITVNGNDPTASDRLVLNDLDASNTVTIATATNTITGAEPVPVTYGTIERISLTTTVAGAEVAFTGSANYTVNPGAETDEATVLTDNDPPVNLFGYGVGETIDLTGSGGGRATVNGTNENDFFSIRAGTAGSDNEVFFNFRATVETTTLPFVEVNAFDGEDDFVVNGNNTYGLIVVNGGDGDDDDKLFAFNAQAAVEVFLNIVPSRTITGYGGPIAYTGLEAVNPDVTGQTLKIIGTTADDTIEVTPLGGTTGTARANDTDPTVNYFGTGTVDIDGGGGEDTVVVYGSSLGETITVSATATTTPGGTVTYNSGAPSEAIEAVTVNGLQGDDIFNVTPGSIPIFIDGGDPIGSSNTGDTINVQAGNLNTTFFPGAEGDEGGIDVGTNETISYDHIENGSINNPLGMAICGTNDDDEITISTTGAGDFDFSVNDSPTFSVTDADSVTVQGKAGDDDLVFESAVAAFGINVTLDGDLPSDGSDTVKINTFTTETAATYLPTGADAGTVTLPVAASVITLVDTEIFLYDGEGDDTLTVLGDGVAAGDDWIEHTPGERTNSGAVRVNNTLAVSYEGLTNLTLNGQTGAQDRVVYNGTGFSDTFRVTLGSSTIVLRHFVGFVGGTLTDHIPVLTANVEDYTLRGADGDDVFYIWPQLGIDIRVEGDGPGASDVLNFAVDPNDPGPNGVVVELDDPATPANLVVQTITQQGLGVVTLSGIETANIDANSNDLVIAGTRTDDVIHYTPLSTDSGTVTADGIATVFNFDNVPQGTNSFTITGGAGGFADKVELNGTSGRDLIRVDSVLRTASVEVLPFLAAAGTLWRDVTLDDGTSAIGTAGIIETITARGRDGDDTFWVASAPAVGNGLYVNIDGGEPRASDALVITNLNADGTRAFLSDADDYVVIHRSRTSDAGNVLPFNASARRPSVSYENVEVVSANFDTSTAQNNRNTGDPNITVMGPDLNEPNEFRTNSAYVGAGQSLQITNAEIFPNLDEHPGVPEDHDYFRVVAETNGTLDFQVYFNDMNALVPGDGNINIEVLDAAGNVIGGTGAFGSNEGTGDQNERVRIPAVAGQTYYLHVYGGTTDVINGYDVTILNEAPPVPYDIELDDLPVFNGYNCDTQPNPSSNSDTGRSHFDNITCDSTPTITFRLDDNILLKDIQGNDGTTLTNNPPDQLITIPFQNQTLAPGYRIAIFDEGTPQQPGVVPEIPIGYATKTADGVYSFTFPNALIDGSHFISARVQIIDPSDTAAAAGVQPGQTGFGDRSQSLEIVVDTIDPPVFFGLQTLSTDGLHPDSDTGNPLMEGTFSDRITSDRTPTFWGLAEANTVIRLYADLTPNNGVNNLDVFLGETTTKPFDGNNQFGNATGNQPNGEWEITSVVNLNDTLLGFPKDGLRRILVNAEDVAGNIQTAQFLEIFIDTQGPRVFNPAGPEPAVFITGQPQYDLFDPKPSVNGPTPLAPSITVNIEDLPIRVPGAPASFLYPALKTPVVTVNPATGQLIGVGESPLEPEYFEVRGDYNGIIPIQSVIFRSDVVNSGSVATGEIIFTFFAPLPDDRYTLIIRDALTDHSGNALDGEMDTIEPEDSTTLVFPSGDLIPGNDFNARFTIDSRPELGVWASGTVWVDINGNETIDPRNADFVNRDIIYTFGNGNPGTDRAFTSDDFFAGNFRDPGPDGFLGTGDDGSADGFDKLAVYGSVGQGSAGAWRFLVDGNNDGVPDLIDTNGNGVSDNQSGVGINFNGLPVAGNFAPTSGDEVGIFTGTTWYFDINGDFQLDASSAIVTAMRGFPIVGDFDGDGLDDLGTWSNDQFQFDLSGAGAASGPLPGNPRLNGNIDAVINFGFIGTRERPLAADLDQDGIDDIGLWSPDLSGIAPNEGAEWFFLVSNDFTGTNRNPGTVNTLDHPFKPVPFGKDLYMQLGTSFSIPIIGNFDPPATGGVVDLTEEEVTDILNRLDVNQDGHVTPLDALIVINKINKSGPIPAFTGVERLMDVNGDGTISPIDVLNIFNYLAANNFIQAEGEGAAVFTTPTTETSVNTFVASSSDVIEVADGQFLAAADTMRIVFAPVASAATELEGLFALLDDADRDADTAKDDEASSSIDSLLAFESDNLFDYEDSADNPISSALDELLGDDELFDFDELAADVLSTYDKGEDLA